MTTNEIKLNAKYVLLRGLQYGNEFFTGNSKNATLLSNGEVGYEIIGYANTIKEAQMQLFGYSSTDSNE